MWQISQVSRLRPKHDATLTEDNSVNFGFETKIYVADQFQIMRSIQKCIKTNELPSIASTGFFPKKFRQSVRLLLQDLHHVSDVLRNKTSVCWGLRRILWSLASPQEKVQWDGPKEESLLKM